MKLRWWRHAGRAPSVEAQQAVSDAEHKLRIENVRAQSAEVIAHRAEFFRRRNHYAETAVAAMLNLKERP